MKISFTLLFLFVASFCWAQKTVKLSSPDGKIQVNIVLGEDIRYDVSSESEQILQPSAISMTLQDGQVFGKKPKVKKISKNSISEIIPSPIYKKSEVKNNCNEVLISFSGDYSLQFRAFNDGVAYRFLSSKKKDFIVTNELSEYAFASDYTTYVPYVRDNYEQSLEAQFGNSFENTYSHSQLSKMDKRRLAFLPLMVELPGSKKAIITEVNQFSYPGMFLHNDDQSTTLKAVFATYPKKMEQGGHNNLQMIVKERENFIAKVKGTRSFPWRLIAIAKNDAQLLNCDLVYALAEPNKIGDISWVKPGKVAWDWWCDWNLYGVDFEAGINTATYKYYVDFASEHNIKYVILDEGWAVNGKADLFQIIPEIDLKAIIDYGKTKNVDIILWAGYQAVDKDMEKVCKTYSEMGVKGFKVDFMDRDDQIVVDFYNRMAETAAKYKLMVDFHGAFKPSGMNRTYPNVINYEGVNGMEQLKWSGIDLDQVTYEVTIPYIRMFAGPMDYTQGAMLNGNKSNYRTSNSEPMSQGTRCRQLAEYVVLESPLNMLCDSPSNYEREEECTKFIAGVPSIWEETVALDGKVASYIAVARRSGSQWYVGAITDWNARKLTLDLSFLGDGQYMAEVFKDGINVQKAPQDYKREVIAVPSNKKMEVNMAAGGGIAIRIYKK